MGTQKLGGVLQENKIAVKDKLNHSIDLVERSFKLGGKIDAAVIYMSGVTDTEIVHEYVIKPLMEMKFPESAGGAAEAGAGKGPAWKSILAVIQGAVNGQGRPKSITDYIFENVLRASELKVEMELDAVTDYIIYGDCAIIIDGEASAICAACKKWDKRAISEPPTSAVLKGPREGFTEDMKANTVQLRRRLRTADLIFEQVQAGRYTNTNICVAYVKGVADETIVKKVLERLKKIDIDGVIDSFYVQQFLEERRGSIFKQINTCEKPDIAVARMLEGRVAVIVDGSPMVLTLPYMLLEDFQNSQDYYTRRDESTLRLMLRVAASIIGLLLPGFYVAVQVYHYDILPIKMLITLANAIHGTPFPPLQEMLLVAILFMVIYDASVMMPRYVGMAVSIVGALVMGDTAVKAGIISSPTVLIVAISMLCSQLVPDQVSLTSFLKLGFILAGGLMGVFGIAAGLLMLLAYMASLDSYGTPFLAPFAPFVGKDMKDALFRQTAADMDTRPYSLPGRNKTRLKKEVKKG